MDDIIDQIDAATGCQQCGKDLGRSVSDDFCSESCQTQWYQGRSAPLPLYLGFDPLKRRNVLVGGLYYNAILTPQTTRFPIQWPDW